MRVKLFPKEVCLSIGKLLHPDEEGELSLLFALPDWVFDGWHDVIESHGDFVKMGNWYITPVAFVSHIEL